MQTFVMGDIHGNCPGLRQCLQRSQFDYLKDTLIQLGDIVDGGGQSYECVEELLNIKNLIAIKGNHDDWLRTFIQIAYHPVQWRYGAIQTANSYAQHAGKKLKVTRL